MAIKYVTSVECDLCRATSPIVTSRLAHRNLEARRSARHAGWVRVLIDGQYCDLCGSCQRERALAEEKECALQQTREPLLTVEEFASEVKVSERTVKTWFKQGLPYVEVAGERFIPRTILVSGFVPDKTSKDVPR